MGRTAGADRRKSSRVVTRMRRGVVDSSGGRTPANRGAGGRSGATHAAEAIMPFTIRSILLLIAVIVFIAVAIGVRAGDVSLTAVGLALFAASFLVPDTIVGRRP